MADTDTTTQATQPVIPDEVDVFTAIGAQDIPESDKAALLVKMVEKIQNRVIERSYDRLNAAEQQELMRLMETEGEDPNTVSDYLADHVPDYEQMFEDEARLLKQELVISLAS